MRDRILDNVIYIFVCLNEPGTPPQYFICTSEEARKKVKQYSTRGIIDLTTLRGPEYEERWDKIEQIIAGGAA